MEQLNKIREQVPILTHAVNGKTLVYFDNAATSQRPSSVISLINDMNMGINANVHRAVHKLSADATFLYENGREQVRSFINAKKREEIIFTSGTTASINLVANSFGEKYLKEGDVVLLSEAEHHSNLVPWQLICEKKGAIIKYIPIKEDGRWDLTTIDYLLSDKVKMVAVSHISNLLGLINPIEIIIEKAHQIGAQVLIDGAQGIVHEDVDVQKLDCDYYAFSGHKIYAATGTGVLYGKEKLLEELPPWMGGGDMVNTVTYKKTTYADLPLKFEAGTPNFVGAATFAPALQFALQLKDPIITDNEHKMLNYLNEKLNSIEGLHIYGNGAAKIPLFSFVVDDVHHSDIATLLDKMGVAVRSGYMCVEPLINKLGKTGMVRASLLRYNTLEECKIFIESLNKAISMLR